MDLVSLPGNVLFPFSFLCTFKFLQLCCTNQSSPHCSGCVVWPRRLTCDLFHSDQQFLRGLRPLRLAAAVALASRLPACGTMCTVHYRRRCCALVHAGFSTHWCTFLAIINAAAVNVWVQVLCEHTLSVPLVYTEE